MRGLRNVLVGGVAVLGCGPEPAADESGSVDETLGESGDGDGEPGDGDGESGDGDGEPGDGDGETGDGHCPPPDPPVGGTLEGEWAELPEPMLGPSCTLGEGDGPAWVDGAVVSESESGIDWVALGVDGTLYAAGWIDDGALAALVAGLRLGGGGPGGDQLWARSWTYAGDAWGARGVAAMGNGRVWLALAPEQLLAFDGTGALLEGPFEAVTVGSRYIGEIGVADDVLGMVVIQRETPPGCLERTRLELHDPTTAETLTAAPSFIASTVFGLGGDAGGGGWLATLDLNGAALTANHYDIEGASIGSFSVTNQGNNVIAADMASVPDGDLVFAVRSLGFIEVQRFSPDGTQQWNVMLPEFGGQYGEPQVAIDQDGDAVVAVTEGAGFLLARVPANGTVEFAGHWSCDDPTEIRDVAVGSTGIWIGGTQMGASSVGFVGNLE
jgi:hypothetical protein